MTLHHLDVVASDVSAGELGYRVDTHADPVAGTTPAATTATGATVLASTVVEHPDGHGALRLSILGASHAVTLLADGRDVLTEEVSCRAADAGGGALPESAVSDGPWGTHRLCGSTETLEPGAFRALVDDLTARADGAEAVLAGRFPGPDGALTVVETTPDSSGWSWQTWHLYPAPVGGGDVVHTSTRLVPVRDAELVGVAP